MEGSYESESFSVSYNKDGNYVSIVWKCGAEKDAARTNSMLAAELISKHENSFLVIDHARCSSLTPDDEKWIKRILIPAFRRAGLKKCFFIAGEDFKPDYIFSVFSEKFDVQKIASIEKLNSSSETNKKLDSMTREEALEWMGLPSDSNAYAIDEKFWQLSKNIRSGKDEDGTEKLDELSAIYDIATGNRDKRAANEAVRQKQFKLFGKTMSEWGTYLGYTWPKILAIVVIVILGSNLAYNIFFKERNDVSIIAVGHIVVEDDSIPQYLTDKLGFKNPYFNYADVVVDNDEEQYGNAYSDQTASVLFLSSPDVIITDEMTYRYYFESYMDMTDIYQYLKENVPTGIMDKVEPVYCSEYEYHMLTDYNNDLYEDYGENQADSYSRANIMVGLKITDPRVISALGIASLWQNEEPSIVLSVYSMCNNYDDALLILRGLLSDWGNY